MQTCLEKGKDLRNLLVPLIENHKTIPLFIEDEDPKFRAIPSTNLEGEAYVE